MESDGRAMADNDISGTIHGPAIQTGAIGGDVHIHVPGAPDEHPAELPAPDGWDDVPLLPAELRSLLRAQVETANELPYRLPGARRPAVAAPSSVTPVLLPSLWDRAAGRVPGLRLGTRRNE